MAIIGSFWKLTISGNYTNRKNDLMQRREHLNMICIVPKLTLLHITHMGMRKECSRIVRQGDCAGFVAHIYTL